MLFQVYLPQSRQNQYYGIMIPIFEKTYRVTYLSDQENSVAHLEYWTNKDGLLERGFDLPAVIHYDRLTGNPVLKLWCAAGRLHRVGAPAYERLDPHTGIVTSEAWFGLGTLHRNPPSPARTLRCAQTGNVTEIRYMQLGQKHRDDGPAVIKYHPNTGTIIEQQHWVSGRRIAENYNHLRPFFPLP